MKNIVFLYTEIAEYFLACIEKAVQKNVHIHIFRWKLNNEAPFQFRNLEKVNFYNREDYSEESLLEEILKINPAIILTSGWIDNGYMKVAQFFRKKKIPVVVCLDNQWDGSFRQRIASIFGRRFIKNRFSHAWVVGNRQKKYALKLGFKEANIETGFYSADYELYDKYYQQSLEIKSKKIPQKFIFVGRYIEQKNIFFLWNCFIEFIEQTKSNYQLISIGTGELFEKRINHNSIIHKGFIQPIEFEEIINNTGIFILPSKFEPWGVVVHEFAIAGYPLVCSNTVGACDYFLEEGKNGYTFNPNDKQSLINIFIEISEKSDEELRKMGENSRKLSQIITPEKWTETLMKLCKNE